MTPLWCIDPSVGDPLLEAVRAARPSEPPLPDDQLWHLETCACCRVSIERTRRLADTYRDGRPSSTAIGAARVRFAARHLPRHPSARRWHVLPRAVTVVLLLAVVVATAAAQIAARRNERTRERDDALRAKKAGYHPGARGGSSAGGPGVVATGLTTQGAAGGEPPVEVREPSEDASPMETTAIGIASQPRQGRKLARHTGSLTDHPASTLRGRDEPARGSWELAAAALRVGDHAGAERALNELAQARDLHTRDAARLARAQLWMSQGKTPETPGAMNGSKTDDARADLRDLAATGITELIRARAREALAQFP
jgi:hypothetical protein